MAVRVCVFTQRLTTSIPTLRIGRRRIEEAVRMQIVDADPKVSCRWVPIVAGIAKIPMRHTPLLLDVRYARSAPLIITGAIESEPVTVATILARDAYVHTNSSCARCDCLTKHSPNRRLGSGYENFE